jgi:hypothetical protein
VNENETDPGQVLTFVPERFTGLRKLAASHGYYAQTYKHARNKAEASIGRWNQRNPEDTIALHYKVEPPR